MEASSRTESPQQIVPALGNDRATKRRDSMSTENDKLREALDQLRAQLEELRKLHPAVAAHLDATVGEAKAALAGQSTQPLDHRSIVRQLSDAVLKVEASHPSLAGNLGSIIDALGRMGI